MLLSFLAVFQKVLHTSFLLFLTRLTAFLLSRKKKEGERLSEWPFVWPFSYYERRSFWDIVMFRWIFLLHSFPRRGCGGGGTGIINSDDIPISVPLSTETMVRVHKCEVVFRHRPSRSKLCWGRSKRKEYPSRLEAKVKNYEEQTKERKKILFTCSTAWVVVASILQMFFLLCLWLWFCASLVHVVPLELRLSRGRRRRVRRVHCGADADVVSQPGVHAHGVLHVVPVVRQRGVHLVHGHGVHARHLVLLLPLHAAVLEPDLDLPLCQAESMGDLYPPPSSQVAVEVELLLQLQGLVPGVGRPLAFGFTVLIDSIWKTNRKKTL